MTTAEVIARESAAFLPTYGRRSVVFTEGKGTWLTDLDGRLYLDFLTGLAVTAIGHAHPAVTEAIAVQAGRLEHVSNLFYTLPQIELAERLQATLGWPDGKVFLCNSGTESMEAAIKLARRHGKLADQGAGTDKVGVVALQRAFHGRTLGSLAALGNDSKRERFAPLGGWVRHVPPDDPDALRAAVDDRTCAVVVEVVQGEGGVHVIDDAVLIAAREACHRVGALLIFDEVQTGIGRLGTWYGWQGTPVVPDVIALAKALGNGLPVGAVVARGQAAEGFAAGDHGSTFGGGPICCAAALAVLSVIEADGLVEHGAAMSVELVAALERIVAETALAQGVRGRGLLQALVLEAPVAAQVVEAALAEGLVVNDVAPDAIRLAPPLNVTTDEIGEAAGRLRAAITAVEATRG